MNFIYYPNEERVMDSIKSNEAEIMLIKCDLSEVILSNIDDCNKHEILLVKTGRSLESLHEFFRVTTNGNGVTWTYICPSNYRGMRNKNKRVLEFYNNGMYCITEVLRFLKLPENIGIPNKYLGR